MLRQAIISVVVFLCLAANCAFGQTCVISDNGDTVEAFSAILDAQSNTVEVTLGNDSKDTAANVTVTVEVTYRNPRYTGGGKTATAEYSGKTQVGPQSTKKMTLSISDSYDNDKNYKAESVKVVSVSGSKCMLPPP